MGWDDNYPASNFTAGERRRETVPSSCVIVGESTGGEEGYFYISYYDTVAGNQGVNAVFYDAEATTNYLNNYQYDPLGWDDLDWQCDTFDHCLGSKCVHRGGR